MKSSFLADLKLCFRIAMFSTLAALAIDGLIRFLRFFPVLLEWILTSP